MVPIIIHAPTNAHVKPGSWNKRAQVDREDPIEIQGTQGTLNVAILALGF